MLGHEHSGRGGKEGGYVWAQQYGFSLTKADLATALAECPICLQQRPPPSAQYGTNPQGGQPVTWWQADYVGLLPLQKEQCFILPGIDAYHRYGFTFPANDHLKTYKMLYAQSWYSTQHGF